MAWHGPSPHRPTLPDRYSRERGNPGLSHRLDPGVRRDDAGGALDPALGCTAHLAWWRRLAEKRLGAGRESARRQRVPQAP